MLGSGIYVKTTVAVTDDVLLISHVVCVLVRVCTPRANIRATGQDHDHLHHRQARTQ